MIPNIDIDRLKEMSGKSLLAYFKFNETNLLSLLAATSNMPESSSISERIYCYLNGLSVRPKCLCGLDRIFH